MGIVNHGMDCVIMTNKLLTTQQAGEILGPSKYTVRDRIRKGQIKAIHVDGRGTNGEYRIEETELERYIQNMKDGIRKKEVTKL